MRKNGGNSFLLCTDGTSKPSSSSPLVWNFKFNKAPNDCITRVMILQNTSSNCWDSFGYLASSSQNWAAEETPWWWRRCRLCHAQTFNLNAGCRRQHSHPRRRCSVMARSNLRKGLLIDTPLIYSLCSRKIVTFCHFGMSTKNSLIS